MTLLLLDICFHKNILFHLNCHDTPVTKRSVEYVCPCLFIYFSVCFVCLSICSNDDTLTKLELKVHSRNLLYSDLPSTSKCVLQTS